MNFQKLIECLEIAERREEFIARLKNAGENSTPVLQVQNAMTELNMHKAPKGIFEKTMLQNMFRFCTPDECFQNVRLVCKPWKNAIETIRFDQKVGRKYFHDLDEAYAHNKIVSTEYLEKYLQAFKKLQMAMHLDNKNQILPLVLKNMKKLNEIDFNCEGMSLDTDYEPFISQMLQKFHKSLRVLHLPKFILSDLTFPNLTKLTLSIGINILVNNFKTCFPQILKKMENLESVHLDMACEWKPILEYINQNYSKHCIAGDIWILKNILMQEILDTIPLLITEYIRNLERDLENKTYVDQIQYVHFHICDLKNPMSWGWDRYREILDQCTNLKAIEFTADINYEVSPKNFVEEVLPTLAEDYQNIWKERITYFEARGIRLADPKEICGNENLRSKLAKEAGIKWRFYFY